MLLTKSRFKTSITIHHHDQPSHTVRQPRQNWGEADRSSQQKFQRAKLTHSHLKISPVSVQIRHGCKGFWNVYQERGSEFTPAKDGMNGLLWSSRSSRKTLRPRLVNVSGSPHGTSRTVCQRMCHTTKTSVPADTTFIS